MQRQATVQQLKLFVASVECVGSCVRLVRSVHATDRFTLVYLSHWHDLAILKRAVQAAFRISIGCAQSVSCCPTLHVACAIPASFLSLPYRPDVLTLFPSFSPGTAFACDPSVSTCYAASGTFFICCSVPCDQGFAANGDPICPGTNVGGIPGPAPGPVTALPGPSGTCDPYGPNPNQCYASDGSSSVCCSTSCGSTPGTCA
jgi:hypothetical protein